MCRTYHLSWITVDQELLWFQYYTLLAVALDLDEREQYMRYILAGGDPKKWPWSTPDRAGTERRSRVWDKVRAKFAAVTRRVNIDDIAQKDWRRIKRIEEQMSDGSQRIRYMDEDGQDITTEVENMERDGHIFMKSKSG